MTITIRIHNNEQYCNEHCPEKVKHEVVECWCIQHPDDIAPADCLGCKGKGEYSFAQYPYEMNLANFNFTLVWSSLGFDVNSPCGDVHPLKVLDAIGSARPELMVRADRGHQVNWFEVGVDREDVEYYLTRLKVIAHEAARREELLSWD